MTRRLLSWSLFAIAGGLLIQAVLAGMFFTAAGRGARAWHLLVGTTLPFVGIIPVVSAWRKAGRDAMTRGYAWGAVGLGVFLWVQAALGYITFPITSVIHVPLGVLLFCGSTHLALQAREAGH